MLSAEAILLPAQQITGVVQAFDDYPLQNVSVRSKKTGNIVFTDPEGMFSIAVRPGDKLLFSAKGFFDNKVKTDGKDDLVVKLRYKFDETSFHDAVGNNHISESALREALKAYPVNEDKDFSKYRDIFDLIMAEISAVRVYDKMVYNIKTISISMSSQVLYVVNDMVVNDISYISPAEIQKIVFLEGAAASEYGIRGANGVLKITLRSR